MHGGGPQGAGTTRPLRVPHVLTDVAEVHAAVEKLLDLPHFVLDIESREESKDHPNPRTNDVLWIGLGGPAQVYLIPMGHPNGVLLKRTHKEKRSVHEIYPVGHPKTFTPLGKLRKANEWVTIPNEYAPPPRQLTPDVVFAALRPLLFSDRGKIGHNVKFDLQSIAKHFGGEIPPGPYHDTILIRHTLEEDLTDYGLKALTCDWFGIPRYQRKNFYPDLGAQGITNFGLDEVARYLAKDLRYCWLAFQYWWARLVRKGMKPVYDFEMQVYPMLMSIEQTGFPVDRSRLDRVRVELETRIREIEQQVYIMADGEFPLSHTDSKRWIMFGPAPITINGQQQQTKVAHGVVMDADHPRYGESTRRKLRSQNLRVISRTTETRVPQVTQAVLEYYADRGNKMAEWFLEWSMLEKLRGTFVTGLDALLTTLDGDLPRIHTGFKQHGTVTGRLSSSPNLQNLPRGTTIRDLFVAGPGNLLIVADYDQIELRCLAHEARERHMIAIFKEGRDIHRQAASAAMRIPLDRVTDDMRQVGKTLNFATGYGAGPLRIAAVAGVSEEEGQRFLNRYYAQFTGLLPWKKAVLAEARARGNRANMGQEPPYVVIPPTGRVRRLPDLFRYLKEEEWMRWRAERQAVNAIIQGFASNITKMAMLALYERLADYPARMLVQVHDEVVIQTDEAYVDDVLPVVTETMGGILNSQGNPILGSIPLVVSAKVGYTWAEAKGK